ncbi:MAG: TnsA endonuclease N-terminal domain-containing protein [Polynucleobacter sp.]|uniref:TnsA endonuclease N-terminal domain-containing protein n=1 Tax=Polynucleobacter sp. TaxID=2029855 RepID=UPI00272472FF|nr:TnsA endonuclease N-terminal domain-containing protein [Polynucleobacter sp.]MDO8714342.1 TnsA endonuclease N-terminal domain-containing protein [Polynucleobacter sp.]
MPVRKVPKSFRNVTGIIASNKAIGEARFESTLERDLLTLLDFNSQVLSLEVQPIAIPWKDSVGKPHTYTPDVHAIYVDQQNVIYEVKYRSELLEEWATLKPKFKGAIHFCRKQGWRYKIMTEVEIRTPYLENAKFLNPFLKQSSPSDADIQMIQERLERLGNTTPSDLLTSISTDQWEQARLMPALWTQVAKGKIGANLQNKLNMNSPIWSIAS